MGEGFEGCTLGTPGPHAARRSHTRTHTCPLVPCGTWRSGLHSHTFSNTGVHSNVCGSSSQTLPRSFRRHPRWSRGLGSDREGPGRGGDAQQECARQRAQSAKAPRQEVAWPAGWLGENSRRRGRLGFVGQGGALGQARGRVSQVSAGPLPSELNDTYCSPRGCSGGFGSDSAEFLGAGGGLEGCSE